ncbi:hypothetical protein [Dysgonomonas sp. 521]|nr:hypothetical protein [Dysgonomonas sp. 521]
MLFLNRIGEVSERDVFLPGKHSISMVAESKQQGGFSAYFRVNIR